MVGLGWEELFPQLLVVLPETLDTGQQYMGVQVIARRDIGSSDIAITSLHIVYLRSVQKSYKQKKNDPKLK